MASGAVPRETSEILRSDLGLPGGDVVLMLGARVEASISIADLPCDALRTWRP